MDETDQRRPEDPETLAESVPAGGAGADSGAADAVRVTEGDTAEIQNVGSVNDIPGVGTRGADGEMEAGAGADDLDVEQQERLSKPGWSREDEHPDAARRNQRVAHRDAGGDARPSDEGAQHLPRQAQNASTVREELDGIVVQTRADLDGASAERIRSVLAQRLTDAGLDLSDAEVDELVAKVASTQDFGG